MMRYTKTGALIAGVLALASTAVAGPLSDGGSREDTVRFTIDRCINTFDAAKIESTKAGHQYWFADRDFLDGRTIKLSVVNPGTGTHAPHAHPEDEFFFVLEGTAEFFLEGEKRIVHPLTSLYCPPGATHGIRNAGDSLLKYLVIKKYPKK